MSLVKQFEPSIIKEVKSQLESDSNVESISLIIDETTAKSTFLVDKKEYELSFSLNEKDEYEAGEINLLSKNDEVKTESEEAKVETSESHNGGDKEVEAEVLEDKVESKSDDESVSEEASTKECNCEDKSENAALKKYVDSKFDELKSEIDAMKSMLKTSEESKTAIKSYLDLKLNKTL